MHKTCPVQIKAAGTADGLEDGQFRAVVSVFNNRDSVGDVVMPGAFTDTLQEWKASGDSIPIYWSHQMHDPDFNIGYVLDAAETDQGLEVLGQLDLDPEAPAKARQVYRLLKGRRVTQFSFAYDVLEGGPAEHDGQSVIELRKLKLYEVGPTPIGANQETELLDVKAAALQLTADLKAGRVLSSKNEGTLRDALSAINGAATQIKNVLAAVSSPEDDASKAAPVNGTWGGITTTTTTTFPTFSTTTTKGTASDSGPVKDEDPPEVKSEEPNRLSSVDTWATAIAITELEGEQVCLP
jgi:HK97 family phage prohead protease